MKRAAFDKTRDQMAADVPDHPKGFDPEFMCRAQGCPNRWSIDMDNGKLCRFHDGEPPERWPEITQTQQWAETERARLNGESKPAPAVPLTLADKRAILIRLNAAIAKMRAQPADPKDWARRLKTREDAGESLNERQRTAWRAALGEVSRA